MQIANHKKDKILQLFKRMEILRPRDLVAIGVSGLPVRKRYREHEWLEMPQLTRQLLG